MNTFLEPKKLTDTNLRRVAPVRNSTHDLSWVGKEIASLFNRRSTAESGLSKM